MSRKSRQDRIRTLTEKALDGYTRARAELERRHAEPPHPGDLFALAETGAWPVEWVVLGRDPEDPERLVAVAADLNPLVGSTDVAIPAEAAAGPLSIRCAFVVRLGIERFESARRTGSLEPGHLDRVRRRRAEIEARGGIGWPTAAPGSSILEAATEGEPEYQDWMKEVLGEAHATLLETVHRQETPAARPARAVHSRRVPLWVFFSRPYPLAASILLAAVLGFLGGVLWQNRQLASEELVNLPVAMLGPAGTLRGQVPTLSVPLTASHFLVLVEVNTQYPAYRLEVREKGAGKTVWASDLTRIGKRELSVALPRRLFPAGDYQLLLYGLADGRADLLEEYDLRLEVE